MRIRPVLFALVLIAAIFAITPASALAQGTSHLDLKALGVSFLPAPEQAPAAPRAAQPQAQASHEGIGIGFKLGPIFGSADDNKFDNFAKKKTGMMYSLFLGGNRPGIVGVATELSLLKKKFQVNDNDAPVVTLTYFEVPVLLRINAGSHTLSGASFYILAGPSFDFRLKAEATAGGQTEDIKDNFQVVSVGLIVGAGVEVTRFIIEGRYTKDLRTLYSDKANANFGLVAGETAKTKAFIILFGIRIN
jgi:hypothetical protein